MESEYCVQELFKVYLGKAEAILAERAKIKCTTIAYRRLQHQLQIDNIVTQMSQSLKSKLLRLSQIVWLQTSFSTNVCVSNHNGGPPCFCL